MNRHDRHRRSGALAVTVAVAGLLALGTAHAAPLAGGNIVASDDLGRLYYVDTKTGAATEIGRVKVGPTDPGDAEPTLTDLAFDAETGKVYGVTFTHFYLLNLANPDKSTCVSDHGMDGINALTASPDGTLFAGSNTGDLFRIDPSTGKATRIGSFGDGLTASGDLTFFEGTLYCTAKLSEAEQRAGGASVADWLISIDPKSGKAKKVAAFTEAGGVPASNVYGLVNVKGKLYALSSAGRTYTVDHTTARLTLVGQAAPVYWGATEFEISF